MLSVTQLCGFGAGAAAPAPPPPAEVAFIGRTNSDAAQNHTLNGVAIGAEHPTRRVVFAVHTVNSVAFRTISSFTVDGVAITPAHIAINGSGFTAGHIALFSVLKPTGTTANLQINTNGTNAELTVEVFRAINETVATPHATMSDGSIAGNTVSGTINIPANGWVMAAATMHGSPAATNLTWTGVTEVSEDVVGVGSVVREGVALQNGLPSETGRAISAVSTGPTAGQNGALAAMSWG
jgi:hypothetical protein